MKEIVLDTETTGLSVKDGHRIVEIGCIELENLIPNKTTIIVGPSPHLKGKNMGNFIDSFDLVVRINELGIRKEYFTDYGSRTDVAFLSLTEESLRVYKKMLEKVKYLKYLCQCQRLLYGCLKNKKHITIEKIR